MKKLLFLLIFSFLITGLTAQELPYKSIVPAPEGYSAPKVIARMIDGLGYRYYWATDSLRAQDLAFGPEEEGRNIKQTMDHVYSLSLMVLQSVDANAKLDFAAIDDYNQLRAKTLNTLQSTSVKLRSMADEEMKDISFRGMPLWNLINGPISDAIYHTGQIVVLRRISGNPMNPKVNVLTGVT
ncbi:MAG: hypothetical protein HWE07_06670, partial [Cytophagia bacterium]|nr:hypothetical protein [Cytophagia bacterium]